MNVSITRRRLLAAGVAASSLALSGCFTPKLYKEDGYSEHVSGFMMTEDGKKLVVRARTTITSSICRRSCGRS